MRFVSGLSVPVSCSPMNVTGRLPVMQKGPFGCCGDREIGRFSSFFQHACFEPEGL